MENKKTTIIAAVSGGADSLAMLHMLHTKGTPVICAHFNHNLRPSADSDAEYVKTFCKTLNIPCIIDSADVAEYAKKNKLSLETAGRRLRYAFLANVAFRSPIQVPISQNYVCVATAHHANDSSESLIMHLLRGCGLGGLCGIAPEMDMTLPDGRTIHLIRPLLNLSRAEIEKYCEDNGITPLTDESNNDKTFFRNKIRHDVMPVLYEHGGLESISRTAGILRQDENFLNELTENWIAENWIAENGGAEKGVAENEFAEKVIPKNGHSFPRSAFIPLHIALKRRIILTLARKLTAETVPLERIDAVIEMIEKNTGAKTIQLPSSIQVSLNKGTVTISN